MAGKASHLTFFDLPSEVRNQIFANLFAEEAMTVEWHPTDSSKSLCRMPFQAVSASLTSRQFQSESKGWIEQLFCTAGVRPTIGTMTDLERRHIRRIVLEDGECEDPLEMSCFPSLQTVVCCSTWYLATDLDLKGRDLMEVAKLTDALVEQRQNIHDQLKDQLPTWVQEVLANPGCRVAVQINVTLQFRQPLQRETYAWAPGVEYPVWPTYLNRRYDLNTGHMFEVSSGF